jgi:N6-L-threonylcarbamoyladenine synthase
MKILSIETSCDETAISILEITGSKEAPSFRILSNLVRSQIEMHKEFGGVFPTVAKREHAKNLSPILIENLKSAGLYSESDAKFPESKQNYLRELLARETDLVVSVIDIATRIKKPDINYIAVTTGPGLEPALWVGVNFARALGYMWDIPVMPVNHMEGHVLSTLIDSKKTDTQTINPGDLHFPALALLISGGHTELVLIKDWLKYEKIGATVDDALGEAFDKVARLLGLPYPGGPEVSRLARLGAKRGDIKLPRPMIGSGDYNFSFSGIKTATLYLIKKLGDLDDQTKKDIALEFETAVTEVLIKKTERAIEEYGIETLIIGGGVSANGYIKNEMKKMIEEKFPNVILHVPDQHLSGDNSLMIGIAGYFEITSGKEFPTLESIKAESNWSL